MLKTIEKKGRLPRNWHSAEEFDVLSAYEMNPKFNCRKPESEENRHMPDFNVRFTFEGEGFVLYYSNCNDGKKKDTVTQLYKEADYLLDDSPVPIWQRVDDNRGVHITGRLPEGIDRVMQQAAALGNDTVLERLGRHTQSYQNINIKIKYGLEDQFENQLPYFTVTCLSTDQYGRYMYGGADHRTILKVEPSLKKLVDMHLRDIEGAPTYPVDNGWYYVSDPRLHGSFNENNRRQTVAEYLDIPIEMANHIVDSYQAGKLDKEGFAAIIDTQRPEWKRKADSVIAEYDLQVRPDRARTTEELENMRKEREAKTHGSLKRKPQPKSLKNDNDLSL